MPRRNHRKVPRSRRMRFTELEAEPRRMTTNQMAQNLVGRGLASPLILTELPPHLHKRNREDSQ